MTKLLFVTQVMDKNDGVLGAYHGWVVELAKHMEQITVICLYEGEHTLPANVRVFSLGKEKKKLSAYQYALRFFTLAWKLRSSYTAVLVHMNQEYLLIAGLMWKMLGKRMYMWRNHYAGSFLTDIATSFCTKVFCTSKHSYTAKYAKTIFMPVGVDTARFLKQSTVTRVPRSILFFARIAPSKRPEIFIEALGLLKQQNVQCIASMYGSPVASDVRYYEGLQARAHELGLQDSLTFHPGVPNATAPSIYAAHEISVNCSPSGMFDKTLFEAAASGCVVLTTSDDFKTLAGESFHFEDAHTLAELLKRILVHTDRDHITEHLRTIAEASSLATLADTLALELNT